MKCPNCQTDNPPMTIACSNCGGLLGLKLHLADEPEPPPKAEEPPVPAHPEPTLGLKLHDEPAEPGLSLKLQAEPLPAPPEESVVPPPSLKSPEEMPMPPASEPSHESEPVPQSEVSSEPAAVEKAAGDPQPPADAQAKSKKPARPASRSTRIAMVVLGLLLVLGAGFQFGYRPWQNAKIQKQKAKEDAEKQAKLAGDLAKAFDRAKAEYDKLATNTADLAVLDSHGGESWRTLKIRITDAEKAGRAKAREGVATYTEAASQWPVLLKPAREAHLKSRIEELLALGRVSGSKESIKTGLASVQEVLKLAPGHAEAVALQEQLQLLLSRLPGEPLTNSLGMSMIWVRPGEFRMGSPYNEPERDLIEIQHPVRLTTGFWLGATEITQGQWEDVMGTTVAAQRDKSNKEWLLRGEGRSFPMYYVNFDDAVEFCAKLTERERAAGRLPDGFLYTLPTEAQWEYACRAGTATPYAGVLDAMGWYLANSTNTTHAVGGKRANGWGFFDMHGNVWEWCLDWYGEYTAAQAVDPKGPPNGTSRVSRGGGWNYRANVCRSAVRLKLAPSFRSNLVGFRVALSPVTPSP